MREEEEHKRLREAIDALPPEYRLLLERWQHREISEEQLAEEFGLTLPAVKSRLHRARYKMRQRLYGDGRADHG